jgi:hypothetical protein
MRITGRRRGSARPRSWATVCGALCVAAVLIGSGTASAGSRGGGWTIVPSPSEDGSNWLQAVDASAGDDAWAVGHYLGDEGVMETLAERWNGSSWSLVEIPDLGTNGSLLNGVASVTSDDAWAVGYASGDPATYTSTTVVEHWTGSAWSVVSSPNPSKDPIYGANQLYDVHAFASNDVWAAGWQWVPRGSAPLVEHWDGRKWKVSPTPGDGFRELQAIDGTSSSDIWAVGHSFSFRDLNQSLAMHWDGSSWTVVPTPKLPIDNYLNGVAVVGPADVWTVGYALGQPQDIQPHFLHWDGSTWSVVPSPHLSTTYNFLQSVVAISANDVWAAGYRTLGGTVVSLVEHWDGIRWSLDRTPNRQGGGNYVYDIGLDRAGGLWAAGFFYPSNFTPFPTLMLHRSSG